MNFKNLIISFIWVFMIIAVVFLHIDEYGLSFIGYLTLFIVALASSLIVQSIPSEGSVRKDP